MGAAVGVAIAGSNALKVSAACLPEWAVTSGQCCSPVPAARANACPGIATSIIIEAARAVSGQFESVLPIGGSLTPANQIRSLLSVAARTIMAKGYSTDLRARAVALVEAGESRREVARLLDLAASTTIRWMDRWQATGNVAAKPGTGYCHSPLEQHEQWLLDLVAAEPDLTLDEIGTRLASAKKLTVGRTSVWRFYDRHHITFKKNTARRRTGSS
jgi:transposase